MRTHTTFNSLSRDHGEGAGADGAGGGTSFNSLSRDHRLFTAGMDGCRPHHAFNSLSRDHQTFVASRALASVKPFNSLSRDHLRQETLHVLEDEGNLSTPSLGITYLPTAPASTFTTSVFQLPLSGSLAFHRVDRRILVRVSFNSLSRDHETEAEDAHRVAEGNPLSTPSLGITVNSISHIVALAPQVFQLPLSGSPSPIPGFFGSPRLSAAAPLRTNEF